MGSPGSFCRTPCQGSCRVPRRLSNEKKKISSSHLNGGWCFPAGWSNPGGTEYPGPPRSLHLGQRRSFFWRVLGIVRLSWGKAGLQPAERKPMRFIAIVLVLALAGCYQPAYLTRETTVERDGDGKILRTIEREMVLSVIEIERMKPEMLKGIKIRPTTEMSPPSSAEFDPRRQD